jgi:UDP-perosamine 4-acetyltransferase
MIKVIIIGSGGHAKVIIDILRSSNTHRPIGCTGVFPRNKEIIGLPVLGDDSILPELYKDGIRHAFVALGDNRRRMEISSHVTKLGFLLINVISHRSYISQSAILGAGIAVMPGGIIHPDSVIKDSVIINTATTIDHDCIIEMGCHIAPGCNIAGNVKIGKGTLLGVGCNVIPQITIGEWSIIGAGAVVVNDLPGYSLALGAPAKVIKKLKEEI